MNNKKVVIITGASRGIGLSTAELFYKKGYTVYNLSRSACDLKGINSIICDITDENKLKKEIDNILDSLKYLETLEQKIREKINNKPTEI